jgi:hypothetical protein
VWGVFRKILINKIIKWNAYVVIRISMMSMVIPVVEKNELSMWRTLSPSNKKDNGIGHCRRKRSFSI